MSSSKRAKRFGKMSNQQTVKSWDNFVWGDEDEEPDITFPTWEHRPAATGQKPLTPIQEIVEFGE